MPVEALVIFGVGVLISSAIFWYKACTLGPPSHPCHTCGVGTIHQDRTTVFFYYQCCSWNCLEERAAYDVRFKNGMKYSLLAVSGAPNDELDDFLMNNQL